MGKSKKKSNKGVVAAPLKSEKKGFKGKRNAEGATGKIINTKKQKKNVEKETKNQKSDKKSKITFVKAPRNSEETSSSEDLSCSDAEEEVKAISQKEIEQKKSTSSEELSVDEEPIKKQPSSIAKNGDVVAKKVPVDGSESGSDEDNSNEEKCPESSKGVSSESESESEEGAAKIGGAKNGKLAMPTKKRACENSESESDEEEEPAKVLKESDSSHGESLNESDDEEETKKAPKKKLKVPAIPQIPQVSGSKTLFVGNLSFSIEKADIEEFFKDAGEIVDVRFASHDDGRFKGFGHVEFASEIAAQKALELNGHELLGRQVRLDVARERGTFTPKEANSVQRDPKSISQTIYVRGFDKSLDEDKIRSSLEEHFGACGRITRISIPKDQGTGESKGMAYMDFEDKDGFSQALELNNSDLGDYTLIVEEAKPRVDSHGGRSGGRGGRNGGQFGGRNGGGRFGGRRGGNRDGRNRNFRGGRGQRRSGF